MRPWQATSACQRLSVTWCAVCWPKTPSTDRLLRCCLIRQVHGLVEFPRDHLAGRRSPLRWQEVRSGMQDLLRWRSPSTQPTASEKCVVVR